MHASEHNHVGFYLHRLAGQREAVANDIGDAVEDLRRLIVMCKNDRVASLLQRNDRINVVGESGPFDRGDRVPHFRDRSGPIGRRSRTVDMIILQSSIILY